MNALPAVRKKDFATNQFIKTDSGMQWTDRKNFSREGVLEEGRCRCFGGAG